MPPKPDLSYIGFEEFTSEPAVETLNAKTSKDVPNVVKKDNGAPIIEDWKSEDENQSVPQPKIEKKIVKPSVSKLEFVKPKQHIQNARKIVKNVEKSRQSENINREAQLHAKVDGKKVFISETSIRRDLQFGDEGGVDCLPNEVIFEQLTLIGAKITAWNEFSSTIASVVICLATNQKFNFSKCIFDNMMKNLDSVTNFLMYPRKQKLRKTNRKDTQVPQLSVPTESVTGEAVNEEMSDSLERATTTATSLDAEEGRVVLPGAKTPWGISLLILAVLAVLITRASQSRQHGMSEPVNYYLTD
nr:hypothetical protein [Tanacetum cinerariifolium]